MAQLGAKLSPSMNVVYPDIGVLEQLHKSLPELANDIAMYIENLENTGKLKVGGEYILIGHSLGGSLALMVSSKLRARHIIQVSTPNEIPAVSKISGFGWFPALVDLRNIKQVYGTIRPVQPIGRLTSIIPKNDRFIGPDVQGTGLLPPNILSQVGTTDGVIVQGGHIDPIDTPSGIANIVRVAN